MSKALQRFKTDYPGVFYIEGKGTLGTTERIYYIRYYLDGKTIEEKAGRAVRDNMTPSKASKIRALRIDKKQLPNKQRRAVSRQKAIEKQWTFQELYDAYSLHRPGKKSIEADQIRFNKHLRPFISNKTPVQINPSDVQAIRSAAENAGLSAQTVRHILALMMRLSNYGADTGLCPGLGFKIKLPKLNNIKDDSLSDEQVKTLMASIEADEDQTTGRMMKLALFTGMRRGEILSLMWCDVDLLHGIISLKNTKSGIDKTIPMNQHARAVFEDQKQINSMGHVFPGENGNQLKYLSRTATRRIMRRAGIPDSTRPMHSLRHSMASVLAASGDVSMFELSKLLTHSKIAMSERYAHLREAALQEAAEKTDKIFDKILNS